MVPAARGPRQERAVRLRQRRRRRAIVGAVGLVYLAAFAWLVSPAWRAPDAPTPDRVAVKPLSVDRSAGIAPIGEPAPLPTSLPESGEATATTTEASSSEPVVESEAESVVSSPSGSEAQASPPPASEPNQQSQETIIASEG